MQTFLCVQLIFHRLILFHCVHKIYKSQLSTLNFIMYTNYRKYNNQVVFNTNDNLMEIRIEIINCSQYYWKRKLPKLNNEIDCIWCKLRFILVHHIDIGIICWYKFFGQWSISQFGFFGSEFQVKYPLAKIDCFWKDHFFTIM